MFEHRTFEALRDEMLEQVREDVDKREGSIIYDAVTPAAIKLAEMYSYLDVFLNLTFADTADGDYLERRAAEFSVYRIPAAPAIYKGLFKNGAGAPLSVPIGSRFSFENHTFFVTQELQLGEYELEAERAGTIGNLGTGSLLPVEPIEGLGSAELNGIIRRGTDAETDESLYNRFKIRTQKQATSGNVYHYEQWALSVAGVGKVKVIPTWDGPNTVKVVLLNLENTPAEQGLVENVYDYIESERPIGALVTVVAASSVPINISASITLASGETLASAQNQFAEALKEYLGEIAFSGELIRYTRIANLLLDIPLIIDYENLLVNGSTSNIELAVDEVGVSGTVVFS